MAPPSSRRGRSTRYTNIETRKPYSGIESQEKKIKDLKRALCYAQQILDITISLTTTSSVRLTMNRLAGRESRTIYTKTTTSGGDEVEEAESSAKNKRPYEQAQGVQQYQQAYLTDGADPLDIDGLEDDFDSTEDPYTYVPTEATSDPNAHLATLSPPTDLSVPSPKYRPQISSPPVLLEGRDEAISAPVIHAAITVSAGLSTLQTSEQGEELNDVESYVTAVEGLKYACYGLLRQVKEEEVEGLDLAALKARALVVLT